MRTTNIRIQAGKDLHDALLAEQEKRRNQTGGKTSLSDIIIEICRNHFESGKSEIQPTSLPVQNNSNSSQKDITMFNEIMDRRLKVIKPLDQYLSEREMKIQLSELDFLKKFDKLLQLSEKLSNDQISFLEQKFQNQKNSLDGMIESKISHDMALKELTLKNDQISELKEELQNLKELFTKTQSDAEKGKDKNMLDKLLSFLPMILAIAGFFLLRKKGDQNADQSSLQKEIDKVLEKLDKEHQDELIKLIKESIKRFSTST
jgi:hypothetical protein